MGEPKQQSRFSAETIALLRSADRRIRLAPPGDLFELYAITRRAIEALANIDTFYIGMYRDERTLVVPYRFHRGQLLRPEISKFGRHGISTWLLNSAKTYRFSDDGGRMLTVGVRFGATEGVRDGAMLPLLGPNREVVGMLSVESSVAGVITDEVVLAMEWLAKALMTVAQPATGNKANVELYREHPELQSSRVVNSLDLLHEATLVFDSLQSSLHGLSKKIARLSKAQIAEELDNIRMLCLKSSSELASQAVQKPQDEADPLATLTSRELEIAELIVEESLSNAAIAQRLLISEKTVKIHVSNILQKIGVSRRDGIAWALGRGSAKLRDSV
ncbi:helix-turn-helix transcriptional regulator [Psychromicrobium lacuslunae]|uniref:helix-turn-helix transcriptional regulator n=1 Tax=Psychromicrobium lacuslunae TaxID=1618207 RepID=UPI000696FACE|nr:LuxR C-terminal-related transcriptional regulator [Psychromicrobium lacuslunae]